MRYQFVVATSKCSDRKLPVYPTYRTHTSPFHNANLLAKCSSNLSVQLNSVIMKLLLSVKDDKAETFMNMLQNFHMSK
ncbi:hypothetical protein SAMN05216327_1225 [Dyadobacter sp. SG02]|nr:hypothetical protein SAMN05216327_1225 [Dyadobacter sp. SG02]